MLITLSAVKNRRVSTPSAFPNATGLLGKCWITHCALWGVYWASITMGLVCAGWSIELSFLTWAAVGSAVISTAIVVFSLRQAGLSAATVLKCLVSVLLVVSASLALGGASHDFSADGQTYQQQAILAMMHGWNPIRDPHYNGPFSIWLSHYAKGAWILVAAVSAPLSIEFGKAICWLFAISAAILSYVLFVKQFLLSRSTALICAALFACNPIFASQIQTFYVDGLVGSLVALAAIATYMLVLNPSIFLAGAVAGCVAIAINLKFTAGPFVIVLIAVISLWCVLTRQMTAAKSLIYASTAGIIIGGCIGINGVLKNQVQHLSAVRCRHGENLQTSDYPGARRRHDHARRPVLHPIHC